MQRADCLILGVAVIGKLCKKGVLGEALSTLWPHSQPDLHTALLTCSQATAPPGLYKITPITSFNKRDPNLRGPKPWPGCFCVAQDREISERLWNMHATPRSASKSLPSENQKKISPSAHGPFQDRQRGPRVPPRQAYPRKTRMYSLYAAFIA